METLAKEHIPTYIDKIHRHPTAIFGLIFKQFSQKPCLLILDNVEREEILDQLPKTLGPNHRKPTILITSRISRWSSGVSVFALAVLSETEAIEFIKKRLNEAGVSDLTDVEKLVTELECLPLALQQAAAYIETILQELPGPITKYLVLFKEATELLEFKEGLRGNEKTTFITWTVTMNKIQELEFGQLAIRIMNIISYFEPDNIPIIRIFDKFSDKDGVIKVIFASKSGFDLETMPRISGAVALLKKYSMVSGMSGVISVHRVVQKVIRIKSSAEDVLLEGVTLLENYISPYTKNDDFTHSLLPHASSVWREASNYPNITTKFDEFERSLAEKKEFFEGPIWFNVYDPVDPFVGREEELKSLRLCLHPEDGTSPLATVLSGPKEIGKTELARKYAEVFSKFYDDNAIWLDGRILDFLKRSLFDLATSYLAISKEAADEMSIVDLYERVCDVFKKRQKKWLLVLDHVSDFEIFRILPVAEELAKPTVLIISTKSFSDWKNQFKVNGLELCGMHPVLHFLPTLVETESEIRNPWLLSLAYKHCKLLDESAAIFIPYIMSEMSSQEDSIDSFIELYKKFKLSEELVLNYGQENHRSVIMTFLLWEMTMASMRSGKGIWKRAVAIATQILNLIAFFEPEKNIPIRILLDLKYKFDPSPSPQAKDLSQTSDSDATGSDSETSDATGSDSETSDATGSDSVEKDILRRAVILLKEYSLVILSGDKWSLFRSSNSASDAKAVIRVHLQVQRLARLSLSDAETQEFLFRGFMFLQKYFTWEFRGHEYTKHLIPHARALWNHESAFTGSKKNKVAFCHFPSLICETLVYYEEYELALQVSKEAAAALEYMFEEETKEYIQQITDSDPSVLKFLHEFNESLQSSDNIYEECVKILGDQHQLILALYNLVTLKLEILERYADAKCLLESDYSGLKDQKKKKRTCTVI